jgi:hypothetical protein
MAWYDNPTQSQINDAIKLKTGNLRQTAAALAGFFGSQIGGPEWHVSEMFGSPAQAADSYGQLPTWQQLGYSSKEEYDADNNGAPASNTSDGTQTTRTTPSAGTGGTNFSQYFGGSLYTDAAQYTNAVNSAAQTEYEKAVASLNKQYQSGLITYDERNAALEQNRQNIRTQAQTLLRDYEQNTKALSDQRTGALQQQAGFFSAVAPDWTQSEEKVLQDKTNEQYNLGQSNLDYTKGINDQAIAQGLAGVDTAQAQLGRERGTYTDTYNENLSSLEQQRQEQIDNTLNNYLGALADNAYTNNLAKVSGTQAAITPETSQYNILPYLQAIAKYLPQSGKSATGTGFSVRSAIPTTQDALAQYLYQSQS